MLRPALAWVLVCAACGGSTAEREDPARAEPVVAAAPAPTAAEEGPREEIAPDYLGDLEDGDRLTYRVTRTSGEELDVVLRVSRVIHRGRSSAVMLSPLGTPLSETAPVYPRWLVGTPRGLFGLEEHVALTVPEFDPLDTRGELVTEASTNVDWHVPPAWMSESAGAFDTDPEQGWTFAGYEPRVEGPVRAERCVRMERSDGEVRTRMVVCANVGMVETSTAGAPEEGPRSWLLVDLGGETSPELPDRP